MVRESLNLNLICHYLKFTIEEVSFQRIRLIAYLWLWLYTQTNIDTALFKCIDSNTHPVILKTVPGLWET